MRVGLADLVGSARAAGPAPLLLDDAYAEVGPWPTLQLLSDPGGRLTLRVVRQPLDIFTLPTAPHPGRPLPAARRQPGTA